MNSFFFFSYPSPFYYVRGASLLTPVAQTLQVDCRAIFQNNVIPQSAILVFNRFCGGRFFSSVSEWCVALRVPYVFDIDDAYWALPKHSTDDAALADASVRQADQLARNATVMVTTTEFLADQIRLRFGEKKIVLVPNCTAQAYLANDGVCIANTDSFKVSDEQLHWFRELLRNLARRGVPVTLLGENQNLIEGKEDFSFQIAGRHDYQGYLNFISQGHFKFGLVPVEPSMYADCKSDIKITEFIAAGMRVYASDIKPYETFLKKYLDGDTMTKLLTLVPHTRRDWEAAAEEILASYPPDELSRRAKAQEIQYKSRVEQFEAWELVAETLREERERAAQSDAYAQLMRKIKNYQFVQRKYYQVRHSRFGKLLKYIK